MGSWLPPQSRLSLGTACFLYTSLFYERASLGLTAFFFSAGGHAGCHTRWSSSTKLILSYKRQTHWCQSPARRWGSPHHCLVSALCSLGLILSWSSIYPGLRFLHGYTDGSQVVFLAKVSPFYSCSCQTALLDVSKTSPKRNLTAPKIELLSSSTAPSNKQTKQA